MRLSGDLADHVDRQVEPGRDARLRAARTPREADALDAGDGLQLLLEAFAQALRQDVVVHARLRTGVGHVDNAVDRHADDLEPQTGSADLARDIGGQQIDVGGSADRERAVDEIGDDGHLLANELTLILEKVNPIQKCMFMTNTAF